MCPTLPSLIQFTSNLMDSYQAFLTAILELQQKQDGKYRRILTGSSEKSESQNYPARRFHVRPFQNDSAYPVCIQFACLYLKCIIGEFATPSDEVTKITFVPDLSKSPLPEGCII